MLALLLAAAFVGPPAPPDPTAVIEARLAEVKRVADGTFTDAGIIGVGAAFDLWTTAHCLERNSSCYEANPLGSVAEKRIALKAAVYPLEVGACYWLRRMGKHKAARWVAVGLTAFHVGLGINNLRTAQ
jgi:hypothetical protein